MFHRSLGLVSTLEPRILYHCASGQPQSHPVYVAETYHEGRIINLQLHAQKLNVTTISVAVTKCKHHVSTLGEIVHCVKLQFHVSSRTRTGISCINDIH